MGMCNERSFYQCVIRKEVPGQNHFVDAIRVKDMFQAADVRMKAQQVPLMEICNNNRNARIKFCLVTRNGMEIHSCATTIADLESGKTTMNAGE